MAPSVGKLLNISKGCHYGLKQLDKSAKCAKYGNDEKSLKYLTKALSPVLRCSAQLAGVYCSARITAFQKSMAGILKQRRQANSNIVK